MAVISLTSITGAGSLGPEAPLVSIGGGLASFVSCYVDLSEAETLFITMCGMGAGLAAFFGEPVGGSLFALEVIHRHGLEYYEAIVPCVVSGLACNWSFRVIAGLPQKPICAPTPRGHCAHALTRSVACHACIARMRRSVLTRVLSRCAVRARVAQGPSRLRRTCSRGRRSLDSSTASSVVASAGPGCA